MHGGTAKACLPVTQMVALPAPLRAAAPTETERAHCLRAPCLRARVRPVPHNVARHMNTHSVGKIERMVVHVCVVVVVVGM